MTLGRNVLAGVVLGLCAFSAVVSAGDDCDVVKLSRKAVNALNEKRYGDYLEYYTNDALVFVNGKLEDANNGRPWSLEQLKCVSSKANVMLHIGDIVSNGDNIAVVSGTLTVNNKMGGVAVQLEYHRGSCKIETEKQFVSMSTDAMKEFMKLAGCECFPVYQQMGICNPITPSPVPGDNDDVGLSGFDFIAVVDQCWGYIETGNSAAYLQNCIDDDHRYVHLDGFKPSKWLDTDPAWWQSFYGFFSVDRVSHSSIQDGAEVQTRNVVKLTYKPTGDSIEYIVAIIYHFNTVSQKLTRMQEISPSSRAVNDFIATKLGGGPNLDLWKASDVSSNLDEFFSVLGFPSYYRNAFDGWNWLYWSENSKVCASLIQIKDMVVSNPKPFHHDIFADFHFGVSFSSSENVAAAIQAIHTASYDTLKQVLVVKAGSVGEAVIDAYLAVKVGFGEMTLEEARGQQLNLWSQVYDTDGALTPFFQVLANQLCDAIN